MLKFVSTSEIRVVRNGASDCRYEYTFQDHLGIGYQGDVAAHVQEIDYYDFGMDIQRNAVGIENKFLKASVNNHF